MESITSITYEELTRQERLFIWLRRNGMKQAEIARALGVGGMAINRMLNKETAPAYRVEQLRELGIPAGLLPRPLNIKPGPKPRNEGS